MTDNQSPVPEDGRQGDGRVVGHGAMAGHEARSASETLGVRLRAARQARDWTLEECGRALRLPVRLLRQIEAGDYAGIDYGIYLRSYLTKYSRHLGVAVDAVEAALSQQAPRQPTLVSTGGIPRSRYLLERYAQAASYIVLTAIILVPVAWFGLRGGLGRKGAMLLPLDSTPVGVHAPGQASPTNLPQRAAQAGAQQPRVRDPAIQRPLQASMAPFSAMREADLEAVKAPPPARQQASQAGQGLSIHLDAPSWVQVTDSAGKRLEYALLPAGASRTYGSDAASSLNVSIGNADAAQVSLDGKPVDLASYRRANVAHFQADLKDGTTSDSGG